MSIPDIDWSKVDTARGGVVPDNVTNLTIRDWFAGQAMQGEIVSQGLEGRDPAHIAGMAYEMADAMLAERSKEVDDGKVL